MSSSQPVMNGMLPNGTPMPNGQLGVRSGGSGVPQTQMQAYLQGQARLPTQTGPDNARVIMEASRLSEQQRLMQQQRQYQTQANGLSGVPSAQQLASMGIPMQANAAMIASAQATNGRLSPASGLSSSSQQPRPSSSPRASNAVPHPGQLSGGMVPVLNQISSQLKAMHPQATAEQIKHMATASLNHSLRAQNQQAQAASMALGATNMPQQLSPQQQQAVLAASYGSTMMNPHMYAQYMRSQQASQQTRLGDGSAGDRGSARPESRGATPQTKSGSVMSGSSQSPPGQPAQMNGSA